MPRQKRNTQQANGANIGYEAELARNKQTTGLGHVTAQDLKRLETAFPPSDVIRAFNCLAEPLFEKAYSIRCESGTLSALRYTLLPKLISGELRVRDAQRFVDGMESVDEVDSGGA